MADQLASSIKAGDTDIHAFLPRPYLSKLLAAREMLGPRGHGTHLHDHYLGTRGIGYQRQVLATLRSSRCTDDPRAPWRRPVSGGQPTGPRYRSGSHG